MQRITTLMLSTLILAGMCLHATAQDAEIEVEVIELEPGIHLKKKIKNKYKAEILRLKKLGDKHQIIIRRHGDNNSKTHHNQVIDLSNGGHAVIESEDGEDGNVFLELQNLPHDMSNLEGMLSQLNNLQGAQGMAPLAALLGNMEGGEWQALAGEAMKHLSKVKIELDGQRLPLMKLMSPEGGLNFAVLQDADDIHVQYGKHGMHFPMKAGRKLFKMFSHGKKGGCCCDCNHGGKKSKKAHGRFSLAPKAGGGSHSFFIGKHGLGKNLHKGHLKKLGKHLRHAQGNVHKNHSFAWSKEAPKSKPAVRWNTKTKDCPNCQQKSKGSNKADFYFKKGSKKHGARRRSRGAHPSKAHKKHMPKLGSLFGANPHGQHKKGSGETFALALNNHKGAIKGLLQKHKALKSKKSKHAIRWTEEMEEKDEDHHHDHDEDGLEGAIENLEREVQKLRRELRRLKRKI